jgi:hypothetical protein
MQLPASNDQGIDRQHKTFPKVAKKIPFIRFILYCGRIPALDFYK